MITWRRGVVTAVRREWRGAGELEKRVQGVPVRALAHPQRNGRPQRGEEGLLNTSALDLRLGPGGDALVVALADRLPPDAAAPDTARPATAGRATAGVLMPA